ncbi:MAG: serine hydrolase [Bacteroidota bacterium]
MKYIFWIISLLSFTLISQAQSIEEMGIPCVDYEGDFIPLRSCESITLEQKLEARLRQDKKWDQLISQKKLAVSVVNLSDLENVELAEINGDEMMYAASLPKIAILLAAMDAIEKGELEETEEVTKDMQIMISKSDNRASTRMIDRLGYHKIARVLTNPQYKLYDKTVGGGLWVGKRYAAGGQRNPDPMEGLSHAATAMQVARFYYMMAFGQLVNEERSEQMLEIMVDPKLHHKLVNTFERIAPEAKLFRKSGSWSVFHSDSIMVWGPERQYILVVLVEDADGENIIRQLGKVVDEVLRE